MSEPKQIIVVRKDLGMRKGKMMAQAAHASMKVFFDRGHVSPATFSDSLAPAELPAELVVPLSSAMEHWVRNSFAKIVVGCDSEEELLELARQANEVGIPCGLIQDAGRTEFHGIPTYTALAIGPDYPEKIDPITGGLKLL